MTRRGTAYWAVAGMILAGSHADAKSRVPAPDGKALEPVLACRAIADGPTRLACYDSNVGALQAATEKHDIVVINQEDVQRARRSLFGFSLPSFDFLGGGKDDKRGTTPEDSRIVATIRAVHRDGDGNWIFTLDDGAVWHQTTGILAVSPQPGDTVEIRRAALSSYFMKVGKQPGFKAKRES